MRIGAGNGGRVVLIEGPVEELFDCPCVVWWGLGGVLLFGGGWLCECGGGGGEGVVHF